MKIIKYGIKNKKTGKLLSFSTHANEPELDGVDVTFNFIEYGETVWLVDSVYKATDVLREQNQIWCCCDYESPSKGRDWVEKDYEVVEVILNY